MVTLKRYSILTTIVFSLVSTCLLYQRSFGGTAYSDLEKISFTILGCSAAISAMFLLGDFIYSTMNVNQLSKAKNDAGRNK